MASVLWFQGGACSGNTMSFLNAEEPSVVDLIVAYPGVTGMTGEYDPDVPTADHEANDRLTAATAVSFAPPVAADAPERFIPPDFAARPAMPRSPLNVVCRLSQDGASVDVWVQFHHAAVDGAPSTAPIDRRSTSSRRRGSWGRSPSRTR